MFSRVLNAEKMYKCGLEKKKKVFVKAMGSW